MATKVRDSKHDDPRTFAPIHDRKREPLDDHTTRPRRTRSAGAWEACCDPNGFLDLSAESTAKPCAFLFVVSNLGEKFLTRLRDEADITHCAMRRASAKTSSAV